MSDSSKLNGSTLIMAPIKVAASDIPASVKIKGKVEEAWKWTDSLGENILITSYVAPYNDKNKNEFDEAGQNAEVHASHFAKKKTDYVQLWQITDVEKSCPAIRKTRKNL